ncbi:MAG: DUF255 domain-containing protein [Melioribacteraceae bacterium]|nr:DUF255 domain-containing protein [Melioribacteraceae bacterium]MCF8353251.1 DUF255 domain-containing protein [Melioribacteraceae bacterium]MCF8393983.1 DUF255 domain-containing protein [Melioribacteraceae bacterium]MCF8418715.1 DUF255 domain-containing protein [Melioribacteraceae bacterium]
MKKLIYLALLLLIYSSSSIFANGLKWYSYSEGAAKAKAENKLLLVDFYTDWCGWCKKMDANTYTDKSVIDFLNKNFVAVKINPEKPGKIDYQGQTYDVSQFAGAAGVNGFPATGFFTSNIELISVIPGYHDAESFLDLLNYFKMKKYEQMGYQEYMILNKLETIYASNPNPADLNFVLGYFHQSIFNDFQKAETFYNKALKNNSKYAVVYAALHEVETKRGNIKKADEWLQKAKANGYSGETDLENELQSTVRKYLSN